MLLISIINFSLKILTNLDQIFHPYESNTSYNLINYFLTGKNERFFNPSFGAGLRSLLFNNITEAELDGIRLQILDDLQLFFPRVEVTNLSLIPNADANTIIFSMRYAIKDSNIEDEVIINFDN